MAMGNSPAMWDKVYDRVFRRREMQSAVNAMQQWREKAISQDNASNTPVVVSHSPQEEVDICISDSESM